LVPCTARRHVAAHDTHGAGVCCVLCCCLPAGLQKLPRGTGLQHGHGIRGTAATPRVWSLVKQTNSGFL
jgi:hypothetical protein